MISVKDKIENRVRDETRAGVVKETSNAQFKVRVEVGFAVCGRVGRIGFYLVDQVSEDT